MNREDWLKRARIGLLYAFMYVAGPLLWGAWMVFRLRLLTPEEYLHCLLSPLTLGMIAVFLAGNLAVIHQAAGPRSKADEAPAQWILRAHCAALVVFGTAGTFLFLVPLSGWAPGTQSLYRHAWLARAGIGALSGASLVFLTYGFFTVAIFKLVTTSAETLRRLRWFYSTLFPLGAVLFVAAAALAGRLKGLTALDGASMALPLVMTTFLFIRTMYGAGVIRRGADHGAA